MKIKHLYMLVYLLLWSPVGLLAIYASRQISHIHGNSITSGTRSIVDMSGRSVAIPSHVNKVGTLEVLGYEKMFLLGQSDKIALMLSTNAPWMARTNPKFKTIPKFVTEPNAEELLNRNIDIAFFLYNPQQTMDKLESIGVTGVVSQPLHRKIDSIDTFEKSAKEGVELFGTILGGDAKKRADEWCTYYDEKVRFVTQKTLAIPQWQRPHVYYLRGPKALNTQGRNSNTLWYGEMAGANMVAKVSPVVGQGPVSMEDILLWDPEYIFVGRQYSRDLVLNDARWKDVRAVKEGKVYQMPEGVFFWDGSSEGVLMMEFIAKTIHPALFPNLNMKREVQDYYSRFYRYNLSEDEVNRILLGKSPAS